MTISSLFIRRPRLAFVVSTVITIAGLLAMSVLPVAQFPDIVPPQVRVTATYPGASAQAVEESVAQVIEGQVNGVEKMIYMKSTSGGDGSYALSVSFAVGSDPDLNTVNVTNRVNQVLALLPPMRSAGAAMTMGRLLGYERDQAVRFSMLLGILPLVAVLVKSVVEAPSISADTPTILTQ